jgi:hypothetical protein
MGTPAQNDEGGERMSAREAERSEWSRQSDAGGDKGRIDDVLKKIERTRQARRHKFYLRDEKITLSHGSGGKATHNLIEGVFAPAFSNPLLILWTMQPSLGSTGQTIAWPSRRIPTS